MAPINPKQLLQAAMASGGSGAAPADAMPIPGAASAAGGAAVGPQGGLQDALPSNLAGAQPVGAENSGVLSTGQLQQEMLGDGTQGGADAGAQEAIAAIQDPKVPPDQKRLLQQQLQVAALRSLTAGPTGAVGAPQG